MLEKISTPSQLSEPTIHSGGLHVVVEMTISSCTGAITDSWDTLIGREFLEIRLFLTFI